MTKVFISYNHQQGKWVWERLAPCLKAGGAEVLIDREQFELGKTVVGQMDASQDQADKHVLVLSEDYLKSKYCCHEMDRAIALDPDFQQGIVVPVLRGACKLPRTIARPNPLYADLRDDQQPNLWTKVFQQCEADLGTTAPAWLTARDDIVRYLKRNQSVNLVVNRNVRWRELLRHIRDDYCQTLAIVDLERGGAVSRRGLLNEILRVRGMPANLPLKPEYLVEFERLLLASQGVALVAFTHFDYATYRHEEYGIDLFGALRALMMEARKLVLLVQSHSPFAGLLPRDHPLSTIDIKTIELGV